jgi:sialic acid synthase SpsE
MNKNDFKFSSDIRIGKGRVISKDSAVFVIAEAACNHMCDIKLALKMIDAAAEAGADSIKFQTYTAEKLVTHKATAFWGEEKISQMEYYKRLDHFGKKEYAELFEYAQEKGVVGFSSPFDEENADMLNELNMPVLKIASCEIPNLNFIRHVAGFGRPIMLSTGASEPEEIDRAIEAVLGQGNDQLILLACTLSYPTKPEDANFLRITKLKERYPGILVGLSDHTEPDKDMVIPSIGAALGAKVIEKHFTLDRSMTGSEHKTYREIIRRRQARSCRFRKKSMAQCPKKHCCRGYHKQRATNNGQDAGYEATGGRFISRRNQQCNRETSHV